MRALLCDRRVSYPLRTYSVLCRFTSLHHSHARIYELQAACICVAGCCIVGKHVSHGVHWRGARTASAANAGPHEITVRWRLAGQISPFFGVPFTMKPYTGTTVMTTDVATGKIVKHNEYWDTSSVDVFLSIFWKGFGAPPAPPAEELRRQENSA